MNISQACSAPIQPVSSDTNHPKYNEWRSYVSACASQLVEASPFKTWLDSMERKEKEKNGLLPYQIVNAHPRGQDYWKYSRKMFNNKKEPVSFEEWLSNEQ